MGQKLIVSLPPGLDKDVAERAVARAVAQAAAEAVVEKVLADTPELIGSGALAQAALREELWREIETEWDMLTPASVALLTGNKLGSGSHVTANLRRRKALAGVKRRGALAYPAFQFARGEDDDTMTVARAWTELRALLEPLGWSEANVLLWAASPNAWLEGRSPASEVRDHPDAVTDALRVAVDEAIPDVVKTQRSA